MSNYSNIIKFISINPTPQTLTFFAFNLSHADERKLLETYNATPLPSYHLLQHDPYDTV